MILNGAFDASSSSCGLHPPQCQDQPPTNWAEEAAQGSVQSAALHKGRGGTDPDPFPSPRTIQQPGPGLEQPFAPGDGSPGRTGGFAERKQHCRCKFQRFIHFSRAATAHSESRSVLDPSLQTPPGTHRPLHPPGPGEHPGIMRIEPSPGTADTCCTCGHGPATAPPGQRDNGGTKAAPRRARPGWNEMK